MKWLCFKDSIFGIVFLNFSLFDLDGLETDQEFDSAVFIIAFV